jgi:hypothetical protein
MEQVALTSKILYLVQTLLSTFILRKNIMYLTERRGEIAQKLRKLRIGC